MQKNSVAMDIAYVAVFSALVIALAFFAIPVGAAGVPIVLQNAGLILAGLILGPRRGLMVGGLFFLLGMVGLPVLPGGRSILAAIGGPSGGYLISYILSPAVAGLIAYRAPKSPKGAMMAVFALAAVAALATQYLLGAVGLTILADLSFGQALLGNGAFILPDLAKAALVVVVATGVHTAFPDLRRHRAVQQ